MKTPIYATPAVKGLIHRHFNLKPIYWLSDEASFHRNRICCESYGEIDENITFLLFQERIICVVEQCATQLGANDIQ